MPLALDMTPTINNLIDVRVKEIIENLREELREELKKELREELKKELREELVELIGYIKKENREGFGALYTSLYEMIQKDNEALHETIPKMILTGVKSTFDTVQLGKIVREALEEHMKPLQEDVQMLLKRDAEETRKRKELQTIVGKILDEDSQKKRTRISE